MNSTQPQRDYITSLISRIGVETALEAGAITPNSAWEPTEVMTDIHNGLDPHCPCGDCFTYFVVPWEMPISNGATFNTIFRTEEAAERFRASLQSKRVGVSGTWRMTPNLLEVLLTRAQRKFGRYAFTRFPAYGPLGFRTS